jgi:glycosyltransferase involved in cell wall biosynthesis
LSQRIALVAASLEILGGQGVQAFTLLERLKEDGCRVSFIPINPGFPRLLRWLRRVRYLRTLLNQALYLPSLRRLKDADVAHVFSASYWSFVLTVVPAILAARALGKRVILNYHSGEAPDHLARWGALVHPWLRRVDAIAVPSEFLRGVFARHGYLAHVVPNVVQLSRFRYRARDARRLRLLSVRNLEPHYRVDNTIEGFALLRRSHPHAELTVAGYGSQEAALRSAALATGGRVRFVGRVDPERVPELYDEHDVFLNSSVIDNQPLSILEAFASGLPVVTTAPGGIGGMVRDGDTGLVVPAGEPAAMAAAVERLLEQPEATRAMTARAWREASSYTWPEVRDRWQKLYDGRAC